MKNKKLGLTLLMAGSLFLTNCTKNKTNEPPSPDYETQSTKDMVQLQIILSDVIEMAGQSSDGSSGLNPYLSSTLTSVMVGTAAIPASPATVNTNVGSKYHEVTFNNTPGNDGHVRTGQIRYDYVTSTNSLVPQIFHRTPGYIANVTFPGGYTVDDYTVTVGSMQIRNLIQIGFPASPLTPANVNLAWGITANLTVVGPGGTRTITGDLTKTLVNTNNTPVPMAIGSQTFNCYPPPYNININWTKAYVSYSGSGGGTTSAGPYTYTLSGVTRNMNSSPEGYKYIAYVAPNQFASTIVDVPERHPYLSGMMTFKEGSKPTRDVDFGTGNVVDYNAKVTIQGVTFDVDCRD